MCLSHIWRVWQADFTQFLIWFKVQTWLWLLSAFLDRMRLDLLVCRLCQGFWEEFAFVVWWLIWGLGFESALVNLPIAERVNLFLIVGHIRPCLRLIGCWSIAVLQCLVLLVETKNMLWTATIFLSVEDPELVIWLRFLTGPFGCYRGGVESNQTGLGRGGSLPLLWWTNPDVATRVSLWLEDFYWSISWVMGAR